MSKKTIVYNRENRPGRETKTGSDYLKERFDILKDIGKRENFDVTAYPYSLVEDNVAPADIEIRGQKARVAWVSSINNPDNKAVLLTVGNIHTLASVEIKGWGIGYDSFEKAEVIATYRVTYNKKTGKKTYNKLKTLEGVRELFKRGKSLYDNQKLVIKK